MHRKYQIEVTVSGIAGTGKSAVARAIEMALAGRGATVKRVDDNGTGQSDERPGVIEATAEKRMEALVKRGLSVTVKTVQARRG